MTTEEIESQPNFEEIFPKRVVKHEDDKIKLYTRFRRRTGRLLGDKDHVYSACEIRQKQLKSWRNEPEYNGYMWPSTAEDARNYATDSIVFYEYSEILIENIGLDPKDKDKTRKTRSDKGIKRGKRKPRPY